MIKETPEPWENLPTIVEVNDDVRKNEQTAKRLTGLIDDIAIPSPSGGQVSPGGWSVEKLVRSFRLGSDKIPTVVASAAPLINLAHALRQSGEQPDIAELRQVTIDAVARYERDLAAARISPERARAAHYVICATIDDVVLSKPWGVRAGWAQSGLVSTFHMDVTGGDRVFELLDYFQQSPGANKDLLLLIYLCLSLAFEGRTRVSARGPMELSRIRDGLYKTLLGQYGVFERELSPHWRGVSARHKPLRTTALLWTLLSLLALVLALGYLFFTLSLNRASDNTFERLTGLPPREPASLAAAPKPEPETPASPPAQQEMPPEPVAAKPSRLDNLLAFLQPEVEKKLVSLADSNGRLLVRINNSGLFATGSAEVSPQFQDLLQRIGGALAAEKFRAVVIGYTDNVPIRTVQFPSNWHLSAARAKAVGDILSAFTGPEAILTEGRADSNPLAPNTTPEGREMNRRTEILVLTDPGERLDAAGISPAQPAPFQENGSSAEGVHP
ncbi:cell envelope biogenesis protein OmpA [Brucella endophytica]|uniref:Cell envelope biogenesis protein OmpA n=1 Tax=Brucella endophytica TaxID=1963359 RepID=A0A916S7K4_9HYPH|nr:type VI secretion system protein TssL, long form [Brucella endophytica]GGA88241.1 cell envelope biogenesis protein OmpA [Brucella endophytica]